MKIKLTVSVNVDSEGELKAAEFSDERHMQDIREVTELPILASCFAAILAGKIDEQKK